MKRTDLQLILEALQRARGEGVHSFHLNHIAGTTRAAARILDLKLMGYTITSHPEKLGEALGVRYFLEDKAPKPEYVWLFEGNKAKRVIKSQKPIQESLL